jgi:plasmid rolling circle replication initiator protein Rep
LTARALRPTVPVLCPWSNGGLLSDASPRDKPWDVHKAQADAVARLFAMPGTPDGLRLAERITECGRWLEFALNPDHGTGEIRLRLQTARFCRVRYCPICQWRRSLRLAALFMTHVSNRDFGPCSWLHLTLTVRNPEVEDLRSTLFSMNAAWQRMIKRDAWPALGFVRTTEITKAQDGRAHPHFHVLLLVPNGYFKRGYISHARWVELWRQALRADYDPSVSVKVLKLRTVTDETGERRELAPVEVLKYAVKPDDLIGRESIGDALWLHALQDQTRKMRFLATGGVLKDALREDVSEDDLLHTGASDGEDGEELARWWFLWFHQRYRKRSAPAGTA